MYRFSNIVLSVPGDLVAIIGNFDELTSHYLEKGDIGLWVEAEGGLANAQVSVMTFCQKMKGVRASRKLLLQVAQDVALTGQLRQEVAEEFRRLGSSETLFLGAYLDGTNTCLEQRLGFFGSKLKPAEYNLKAKALREGFCHGDPQLLCVSDYLKPEEVTTFVQHWLGAMVEQHLFPPIRA